MAKIASKDKSTALKAGTKAPASNKRAGKSPIGAKAKNVIAPGGGRGTELKAKSELFLTAVTTFAGEKNFYESGQARIDRIVSLVHGITKKDPDWMERFVAWLRGPDANIRTASIIIAAEYVAAGGPNGRKVIDSVCQRAEEPAEVLSWWMQNHYGWETGTHPIPSPKLPQALRKGLSDAVRRLYNEYTAMKYNGSGNALGMAEVLNLIHPKPVDDHQSALFSYIIDRSYGNDVVTDGLPMIAANHALRDLTPAQFRKQMDADAMKKAGVTWEQVAGYLGGGWDAAAWEAVIPTMGYMALLRNLRNFEKAGISTAMQDYVIQRLTDPEGVANSRQLPFRFLSAYKNVASHTYTRALEQALDLSVSNITAFQGKTLAVVDVSGSMDVHLSNPNNKDRYGYTTPDVTRPKRWEVGSLFATALALKGENVDLIIFGSTSKKITVPAGSSVLKGMERCAGNQGVGHGTQTNSAIAQHYKGHDRVVIFTDVQPNRGQQVNQPEIPFIHYFDLSGNGTGAADLNQPGRFQYGGFTDSTFKLMSLLETGNGEWPF